MPTTEHNYERKLREMAEAGAFEMGETYATEIRHDDWCALLTMNERCDCDPDITVQRIDLDEPGGS